jgi:hypothetical protein
MELNYWTSSKSVKATQDANKMWHVTVQKGDMFSTCICCQTPNPFYGTPRRCTSHAATSGNGDVLSLRLLRPCWLADEQNSRCRQVSNQIPHVFLEQYKLVRELRDGLRSVGFGSNIGPYRGVAESYKGRKLPFRCTTDFFWKDMLVSCPWLIFADNGASQLIIDGKIKIKNDCLIKSFTEICYSRTQRIASRRGHLLYCACFSVLLFNG